MCEPATVLAIATTATSVIGSISGHNGAKQQSNEMKENAATSLRQNYSDLNERASQEAASSSDAVRRIQRQIQAAQGQTLALSGAAGVTGQSVAGVLGSLVAEGSDEITTINRNLDNTNDQLKRQQEGAKAAANNRATQVNEPSLIATGLQIGGSALELATRLKSRKPLPGGR